MIGIATIREKRGIQRDRSNITVQRCKKIVENNRRHNDPGEKVNPMRYVSNKGAGRSHTRFFFFFFFFFFSVFFFPFSFSLSLFFFSFLGFYADLNNIVVSKCPNY
jgi:hypothetical protein